jgi:hydrogenase maturation protease
MMDQGGDRILLIGYGNPGRLDDGLGPALAAALDELRLPGVTIDADYQLTVEDAASVAEHDVVVFADADVAGPEPFWLRRIEPDPDPAPAVSFSSHSVEPEQILALAHRLFGARTQGYVLAIRGYAFNDFGEGLSEKARANLAAALQFIEPLLRRRSFRDVSAEREDRTRISMASSIGDQP